MIKLESLVGANVVIETNEGAMQTGKLTAVEYFQTTVGDDQVKTVKRLIMNGDQSEFADWPQVKSIKRYNPR